MIDADEAACVMCAEARGEDSVLVHADEVCSAFVAREQRPRNHGQVLVVTRNHYADLYDAPPSVVAHLFEVVRLVAWAAQSTVGADGTTIHQNNRPPGQDAFHLHVHVFPRFHGDGFLDSEALPLSVAIREDLGERIRTVLRDGRNGSGPMVGS